MKVRFFDPAKGYLKIKDEIDSEIQSGSVKPNTRKRFSMIKTISLVSMFVSCDPGFRNDFFFVLDIGFELCTFN